VKISINWLKQYTDINLPIEDLISKIGAQLGEVDAVINLGERYKDIIVVNIVSCIKHPNADKLHICKIDDGGRVTSLDRDSEGYIQVVCGAPNVHKDMMVAWLPPGVTVPSTYDKDPFVMECRDIRGEKSNGMLASSHELAISDDHNGIVVIDLEAQPGMSFAELYQLDDFIIDIENKMFTHRPDCFGMLGVAREVAGIQNIQFKSPDWYINPLTEMKEDHNFYPLKVENELPDLVPRFMAMVMSDIVIKPSPLTIQTFLSRIGVRPINNIVDITNYLMVLTAQPLHAYDYDKLRSIDGADSKTATINIRKPKHGEKLKLLNGKVIEPRTDAIMIATHEKFIGLAGVMGGEETEVDKDTKNVVIECATFDMYSIRKTSMQHGLFTDAVTRFNKGQSPLQNDRVIEEAAAMITLLADGQVGGEIIDVNNVVRTQLKVSVSTDFINQRLGLNVTANEVKSLLENVEFLVSVKQDLLEIHVPFWRTDISLSEDIVEEVGRLIGYDQLPLSLPNRNLSPTSHNKMFDFKSTIRNILSSAGANEVLTYSFISGSLLNKVDQNIDKAFKLTNAISPNLHYYRLSLVPSLLEKIHSNIKSGFDNFVLFELNKVHIKGHQDYQESNVPAEDNRLAVVIAVDEKIQKSLYASAPYYQAKKYLDVLMNQLNLDYYIEPVKDLSDDPTIQSLKPFMTERSGYVYVQGEKVGIIGELNASTKRNLKLPEYIAAFELDVVSLQNKIKPITSYTKLARFPKIEQDICLRVPVDISYRGLFEFVLDNLPGIDNCKVNLSPVDIFQHKKTADVKQITLRVSITSYERTLTDDEVNTMLDTVAEKAKAILGADRV